MGIISCQSCKFRWNASSIFGNSAKNICYRCGSDKLTVITDHAQERTFQKRTQGKFSEYLKLSKKSSLNEQALKKGYVEKLGQLNHYNGEGLLTGIGSYKVKEPHTEIYKTLWDSGDCDEISLGKCGGLYGTEKIEINKRWYFYKKRTEKCEHVELWNKIYKGTGYDVAFYLPYSAYYPAVPGKTLPLLSQVNLELDLESEILRAGQVWLISKFHLYQEDFCSPNGVIFNSQNFLYQICHHEKMITYYPIDMSTISKYEKNRIQLNYLY